MRLSAAAIGIITFLIVSPSKSQNPGILYQAGQFVILSRVRITRNNQAHALQKRTRGGGIIERSHSLAEEVLDSGVDFDINDVFLKKTTFDAVEVEPCDAAGAWCIIGMADDIFASDEFKKNEGRGLLIAVGCRTECSCG